MLRNLLLLALLAALGGCAGTGSNDTTDGSSRGGRDVDNSADAGTGRVSPLGLGQPDPERMFQRALAAHEAGDFWGFMSYFAFIDKEGKYFIPREADAKNAESLPDQRATRALAQSFRSFIGSDWVSVNYGRPRNVRDEPTTSAVPMTINYDFNRLTPERRQEIVDEFNIMLELQGVQQRLTWEQYKSQLMNGPRTAERRFVRLDGAWRFDAGWRLNGPR